MTRRKTPVLLRRSPLTNTVYAITRYSIRKGDPPTILAIDKHDVTDDFYAIVAELDREVRERKAP